MGFNVRSFTAFDVAEGSDTWATLENEIDDAADHLREAGINPDVLLKELKTHQQQIQRLMLRQSANMEVPEAFAKRVRHLIAFHTADMGVFSEESIMEPHPLRIADTQAAESHAADKSAAEAA